MSGHLVRSFVPGDQSGVVAVYRAAMELALVTATDDEREAGRSFIEWSLNQDLKDIAGHYLGSDLKHFWVALAGTQIAGTVGVDRTTDGTPEIRRMVVHPDFHRQGIAGRLLGTAERWAVSRGDRHIVLTTAHPLRAAIALYESRGYTRTGSDQYGPIEAIHFSKNLTVNRPAAP